MAENAERVRGACDTHMHVYDPRFEMKRKGKAAPRPATLDDYRRVQERLGLERVVVVQSSAYLDDNGCTLDAMSRIGENARGVAVVKPEVHDAELERLTREGMRGLRYVMFADARRERAGRQRLRGPPRVHTDTLGIRDEAHVVERTLVREQRLVHGPERVTLAGRLRHLGRVLRVWVRLRQREVAVHEPEAIAEPSADVLDDRKRGAAVRAFVVTILDERDWRVRRAGNVIVGPDLDHALSHCDAPVGAGSASSAERMPSAPGLTPTGDT